MALLLIQAFDYFRNEKWNEISPYVILGAVFATLAAMESLIPLLSDPLTTVIYANTLDFFPGAVYLAEIPWYFATMATFL